MKKTMSSAILALILYAAPVGSAANAAAPLENAAPESPASFDMAKVARFGFGMTFNRIQREKRYWAGVSPKRTVTISREFSMGMPETIPQCGISYEEAQATAPLFSDRKRLSPAHALLKTSFHETAIL